MSSKGATWHRRSPSTKDHAPVIRPGRIRKLQPVWKIRGVVALSTEVAAIADDARRDCPTKDKGKGGGAPSETHVEMPQLPQCLRTSRGKEVRACRLRYCGAVLRAVVAVPGFFRHKARCTVLCAQSPGSRFFLPGFRWVWHSTNPRVARSRWFKPCPRWNFSFGRKTPNRQIHVHTGARPVAPARKEKNAF